MAEQSRERRAGARATQALTQLEFRGDDFDRAEAIARRLGYTQTAYTSTSDLWGLFCLKDRPGSRAACIVKTAELGWLVVSDLEDLNLFDLADEQAEGRDG